MEDGQTPGHSKDRAYDKRRAVENEEFRELRIGFGTNHFDDPKIID